MRSNRLLNARDISSLENRRLNNINQYIQRWAQSSPLPSGNVNLPKGFLSNDPETLHKSMNLYRSDEGFRHNPQGNEAFLSLNDTLWEKYEDAKMKSVADHNPDFVSFERDLHGTEHTPKEEIHQLGYYHIPTDSISADRVYKDARQLGRLRTENYGDFLNSHPKFAKAIDVVPAPKLRQYNHEHGQDKYNLGINNMAEYYKGNSVRDASIMNYQDGIGYPYDSVNPASLQLRARFYVQAQQAKNGQRVPRSLAQGYKLMKDNEKLSDTDMGFRIEHSPELASRLNVLGEPLYKNFVARDAKTKKGLTRDQLLDHVHKYVSNETKQLLDVQTRNDVYGPRADSTKRQLQVIANDKGWDAFKKASYQPAHDDSQTVAYNDTVTTLGTDQRVANKSATKSPVAKDNFGKFFDKNPEEAKRLGIYSGNQMTVRLHKMIAKGNALSAYLSKHTGSTKTVNYLENTNSRLAYISARLDPKKVYTDKITDMPSDKVKPLNRVQVINANIAIPPEHDKKMEEMLNASAVAKPSPQVSVKEPSKPKVKAQPKVKVQTKPKVIGHKPGFKHMKQFNLYDNNYGKFFDNHKYIGKRLGIMSGRQAWDAENKRRPKNERTTLAESGYDPRKAYDAGLPKGKRLFTLEGTGYLNHNDILSQMTAHNMNGNEDLQNMLAKHGSYDLDPKIMTSSQIEDYGLAHHNDKMMNLGMNNSDVYNSLIGYDIDNPFDHSHRPHDLQIPARSFKDGSFKKAYNQLSDVDKHLFDGKSDAVNSGDTSYKDKQRVDEAMSQKTFNAEAGKDFLNQMNGFDKKYSNDPGYTVSKKMTGLTYPEKKVVNDRDFKDLKAFKSDIDKDAHDRNHFGKEAHQDLGSSLTVNNMARKSEAKFLNERPNLKTLLYLKTSKDGNVYIKNDKALRGKSAFTLNSLSNRVDGLYKRMSQERSQTKPHQYTPAQKNFFSRADRKFEKYTNDSSDPFEESDLEKRFNSKQHKLLDERDPKYLAGFKSVLNHGHNKDVVSAVKYLNQHPNVKYRLGLSTEPGREKIFAKSQNPKDNPLFNVHSIPLSEASKRVDKSINDLGAKQDRRIASQKVDKINHFAHENEAVQAYGNKAHKIDQLARDSKEMQRQPGTKKYHLHNLDQYRLYKQMGSVLKGNSRASKRGKAVLASHKQRRNAHLTRGSANASKNLTAQNKARQKNHKSIDKQPRWGE